VWTNVDDQRHLFTGWLDDVVLLGYGDLQRFKVVALINMDVLVVDVLVLTDEVKAFDSHDV
jgi:hypothetical protein